MLSHGLERPRGLRPPAPISRRTASKTPSLSTASQLTSLPPRPPRPCGLRRRPERPSVPGLRTRPRGIYKGLGGSLCSVFVQGRKRPRVEGWLGVGIEVRPRPGGDELHANAVKDVLGVFEDVAVEEAQHREPEALEPVTACVVASTVASVRRPVGFDHEPGLGAEEVGDERPDGVLAAKLRARQPPAAQQLPQRPLCGCRGAT